MGKAATTGMMAKAESNRAVPRPRKAKLSRRAAGMRPVQEVRLTFQEPLEAASATLVALAAELAVALAVALAAALARAPAGASCMRT